PVAGLCYSSAPPAINSVQRCPMPAEASEEAIARGGATPLGSSAAPGTAVVAAADNADFFLALVLSLLAIVLFLFAALVIVCCLYRRSSSRRQRRREAGDEDYDPYLHDTLVTKKHVPVIFAEELDDNRLWPPASGTAAMTSGSSRVSADGDGGGGPLVLPEEKPPARMPDDAELDGNGGGFGGHGGGGARLPDLPAGFERLRYGNKPAPPPP
ncbi:hypothetical protein BOX15_Mlig002569g1, partial [Macrostomum lignano]